MQRLLVWLCAVVMVSCGSSAPKPSTAPSDKPGDPFPSADTQPRTVDMEAETITGTSPYPPSPRGDAFDTYHGVKVEDPYRWLENVDAPQVQAWMQAQDTLTRQRLAALPQRPALVARFKELFYRDEVTAPMKYGARLFYARRHKDKEKSVVYWKQGEKGKEIVLLDPNVMSEDGSTSLGGWFPSWDGKQVAYALKENNADESTMYVRDVATGTDSKVDVLPGVKYAQPSWTPDNKGFYYVHLPKPDGVSVADRPGLAEVRYHRLGTAPGEDRLVFPSIGDPRTFLGTSLSRDGKHLFLYFQRGWNSTKVYVANARKKVGKQKPRPADLAGADLIAWETKARGFKPLATAEAIHRVSAWKGWLYIWTNDGAPNYRLFKTRANKLDRKFWKEIVPEGDATLEGAAVIGGRLVLTYLRNVATEIEVRTLDGKPIRRVELPGIGTAGISGFEDQDTAWVSFSSFTTPREIHKTSMRSGKIELWNRVELPVDTSDVVAKQVRYKSKDGTEIPMFLVHKKDVELDGTNPTVLTGYGGFNVSRQPYFSVTAVAWVENGGVFAMANLRGGGEFGEDWHRAGMLLNKQNVFDDFIAAAEYLVREGYTKPQHLAITGGSNGGLLVGAAMTQRPELFGAVVCAVPLLDMVRYHLFGSGKTWIPEYGSSDDEAQFGAIYAYSPYHRIKQGTRYPALLMLAADSDDRVDPMHARKFTAAIQWASDGDAPALIRIEKNAGHGGADLVKQNIEKFADSYAFLLDRLK